MTRINTGRVLLGGLASGVVMNILDAVVNGIILKADFDANMALRNIDPAATNLPVMAGLDFAMAVILVYTYAAIRPRFGPGPKTAFIAGLIVAMTANVLAGYFAGMGFFGWPLFFKAAALSTTNVIVAGLVGCAVYKEPPNQ